MLLQLTKDLHPIVIQPSLVATFASLYSCASLSCSSVHLDRRKRRATAASLPPAVASLCPVRPQARRHSSIRACQRQQLNDGLSISSAPSPPSPPPAACARGRASLTRPPSPTGSPPASRCTACEPDREPPWSLEEAAQTSLDEPGSGLRLLIEVRSVCCFAACPTTHFSAVPGTWYLRPQPPAARPLVTGTTTGACAGRFQPVLRLLRYSC